MTGVAMTRTGRTALGMSLLAVAVACSPGAPTAADATKFLADVNETMLRLSTASQQADWTYSTYITPDTEAMNARANQMYIEAVARYAKEAARFNSVSLPADER